MDGLLKGRWRMKTKMILIGFLTAGIIAACLIFLLIGRESPQKTLAKEFLNKFFTVSNFNDPAILELTPEKLYGDYLTEEGMNQILSNRWGALLGNAAVKNRCNIAPQSLVLEEYRSGYEGVNSKLKILDEYGSEYLGMTRFNYHMELRAFYPESQKEKVISVRGSINIKKEYDGYRIDYLKIDPLGFDNLFAPE